MAMASRPQQKKFYPEPTPRPRARPTTKYSGQQRSAAAEISIQEIEAPAHGTRVWSLVFSVRINQFRGIFTAKMRLVRLFPDACNGDVTCITQHFGPHAEHFQRDPLLNRASRVSLPDTAFPSQ